jgi:tetratricopeptide (TPR) repeat protein
LSRSKQDAPGADTLATQEEAAREFEQELALDPTNANAAYELGELHRKRGRLDRAQELFETAVQHYPEFEDARIGLGRVLIASGKPDLGVPHLEKALSLNPGSEVACYQLSLGYGALGRMDDQQRVLAALARLRDRKQPEADTPPFVPRQVTKQEPDSGTDQ